LDKALVTGLGAAALLGALAISVRWGALDTSFRSAGSNAITGALRRLCALEVAGIAAGLLVGGLGSRLMMRIIAATSSPAAQGRITDAGEVVGKVTQEGTVGLLIFVGIGFGVLGALVYGVVGRFLPKRAWLSGVVLGLLVLGVFARRDPLSPHNRDFHIVSPVLLAVAMIVALFLIYGTTVTALAARLERAYPQLEAKPRSLVAFVPLLVLAIPPLTLAIAGAILVGAVSGRFPGAVRAGRSNLVSRAGIAVVAIATVAGNVWLGFGVADILR